MPSENKIRIRELLQRRDGGRFEILCDQKVDNQYPAGPPKGWDRWMLDSIDAELTDWVICFCGEAYYRRFRGKEQPPTGLGVQWEGAIITQGLYESGGRNHRFIPVLFDRQDVAWRPEPLRPATYYLFPEQEEELFDRIAVASGGRKVGNFPPTLPSASAPSGLYGSLPK